MKRYFLLFTILLLTISFYTRAQDFEVPQNYVLKEKADYPKYQADLLKAIDWLQKTPCAEQADKRKQVNGFVIAWISGSPTVSIEINEPIAKLSEVNNELLVLYMAGYTKYVLENPNDNDKNKPRLAGVKAVLTKYQNDKSLKKDKGLDKLVQLDKDGKLDQWMAKSFS